MPEGRGVRSGSFVAGVIGALAMAGPALAQAGYGEQLYREEALGYAQAVAAAYRRLEDHILVRSTAVTGWSGSIPPETVGWLPAGRRAACGRGTARTPCWCMWSRRI